MSETMRILHILEWEDGWNKTTSISCFTDSPNMLAEHEDFRHFELFCDLPSPFNSDKRGQEDPFWSLFWPGMFDIHELFTLSVCCQAGMNLNLILGRYHISMINGIILWSAAAASSSFIPPCHASPFWKCWLILPRNKCECRTQTCPQDLEFVLAYREQYQKKEKGD